MIAALERMRAAPACPWHVNCADCAAMQRKSIALAHADSCDACAIAVLHAAIPEEPTKEMTRLPDSKNSYSLNSAKAHSVAIHVLRVLRSGA